MVDTSKQLEEAEKHVRDDNVKQSMANTRAAIMETMLGNINRFANGETVVDQSNITDVYDGSMEMYQYVEEKNPKKVKATKTTEPDFSGMTAEEIKKEKRRLRRLKRKEAKKDL